MLRSDLKNRAGVKSNSRTPSSKPSESVADISSPCYASHEGSFFKENININKCETSKLNVEPLQMKRKKKGGEHNLRKSLAWDRAFFTEEGVLDPLELSIISGASCREGLPVINEDTPCSSQLTTKSTDRQKPKYNLLKEFRDEHLGKDRRKPILSSKLDSSSSNIMNSNKVSTWVGSKSGSGSSGCPIPLPPASYPLPANVNTSKAAAKEVKLLKVPGSKTGGPSPVQTTSESNIPRANCVNHNQIVQPVFSIQRNAGLRSFSKSFKTAQTASKVSSLRSARQLERNSSCSSFKGHSSVNMSPVLAEYSDENSVPKIVSDNMTPPRPVHSSEEQYKPLTSAASLAQNAHESGRRMHPSQDQTMKPSGLRMPSPSLSFFSQPKASVLQNLSLRDTDMEICGSQKSGDLKLQETLRRAPQKESNMPNSISSSGNSMSMSSRSGRLAPFHVNDSSHKPNLDSNSTKMVGRKILYDLLASDPISFKLVEDYVVDGQVQDLSNKIGKEIFPEDAEKQRTGSEMPSQSGSYEQMIDDKNLTKAISPIKSESCGSGWRNSESMSEHKYAIHGYETKSVLDESCKELDTCNFDFKHGSVTRTQSENVIEQRAHDTQARQEQTCKPDCHEPCRNYTDQSKHCPGATDKRTHKDKNETETKEITSELLGESLRFGTWCSGSGNHEALKHVGSKHQHGYISNETAVMDEVTEKLLVGEAHVQDALRTSTIRGYRNSINLISDDVDDKKQSGKHFEVQNVCLEVEQSERNAGLIGLLPRKQICLKKSQQENFLETLSLVLNRNDGNKLSCSKVEIPRARREEHGCSFDKDKMNGLRINNNLIHMTSNHDGRLRGKASSDASSNEIIMSMVALDGRWQYENDPRSHDSETVNKRLSKNLYQESLEMEIDHHSSFSKSKTWEVSHKNVLRNVTDAVPVIEDYGGNNCGTSTMPVKGGECDMNYQRSIADSGTVLAKSPSLNACCVKQSECLELPNAGIVAENLLQSNDGLQFGNISQRNNTVLEESSDENVLGSMVDSFTVPEICVGIFRKSSGAVQELPLKHENCSTADGSHVESCIEDAVADTSRIKPFPDPNESEVCQDTSTSFNEPHPKLENDQRKAALTPKNKYGNGLNEKSRTLVLPQNAVPFSDEWLAAIEAAGEDILTRKSGAVQNSPTDKSLPEPSPWSPVKRKNNEIGPFDCTKYTNILPSEYN
ncbi:hypothetical protein ACJIZ3_017948 [Penstemon smallii]|uniref:Uncharacterized protein n=1 Tax=Penstemon smallii TaxID=265156 RepID=A0ABD3SWY8_9LAMI